MTTFKALALNGVRENPSVENVNPAQYISGQPPYQNKSSQPIPTQPRKSQPSSTKTTNNSPFRPDVTQDARPNLYPKNTNPSINFGFWQVVIFAVLYSAQFWITEFIYKNFDSSGLAWLLYAMATVLTAGGQWGLLRNRIPRVGWWFATGVVIPLVLIPFPTPQYFWPIMISLVGLVQYILIRQFPRAIWHLVVQILIAISVVLMWNSWNYLLHYGVQWGTGLVSAMVFSWVLNYRPTASNETGKYTYQNQDGKWALSGAPDRLKSTKQHNKPPARDESNHPVPRFGFWHTTLFILSLFIQFMIIGQIFTTYNFDTFWWLLSVFFVAESIVFGFQWLLIRKQISDANWWFIFSIGITVAIFLIALPQGPQYSFYTNRNELDAFRFQMGVFHLS